MRKRKEKGRLVYVLNLEGGVVHSRQDPAQQAEIQREMRAAIPERVLIDVDRELSEFQIVSSSVAMSARFIVALAAYVSGDLDLCLTLMREVEATARAAKGAVRKAWATPHLAKRAGNFVEVLLLRTAGERLFRWGTQRSDGLLEDASARLEELRCRAGETPPYLINMAFLAAVRDDLTTAEALVIKCKARDKRSPVWRFSLAFLRMKQGRSAEALALYSEIDPAQTTSEVLGSVEDFLQWWLETKKDNCPGLWLLLAKLNIRFKGDIELAEHDLARFRERVTGEDVGLLALAQVLTSELAKEKELAIETVGPAKKGPKEGM